MLFSAELSVWFICAQENGFLDVPENSQKITRKSTHPKEPGARSGTRGSPGGPRRPPGAARGGTAPSGRLGSSPLLWCPTETPIYPRDEKTPEQKSFS